jgi:Tfp pilus assembly protein PilO
MVGLDLNDFKTQRAIGIILAGLVVGGLIWYFMIKDKSDELSGLKAVTAQRNDELNQILTLRPHLEKMR